MTLEYSFQPLSSYPRKLTPAGQRQKSPFGKTWSDVRDLLERELRHMRFRRGSVVLQTAHSAYDVRKDGQLRSDVRRPEHPGVVLRFDAWDGARSKYIRMSFECDRFTEWKDNVRAIADAMEALRKIDRYGVSSGGRTDAHYEGYKALPSADGRTSYEEAATFIAGHSGWTVDSLSDPDALSKAYRQAAVKLHPDKGGSHDEFVKLQEAYRVMGQQQQ